MVDLQDVHSPPHARHDRTLFVVAKVVTGLCAKPSGDRGEVTGEVST
jgi:hypothetical protein